MNTVVHHTAIAISSVILIVGSALGGDFKDCGFSGGLAACTRAIESGKYRGNDLAKLYYNRGIEVTHDYDRSIADFSEAIRLNPTEWSYRNNRGMAYTRKRDFDRAIADYNEAIRLNPEGEISYVNRGRCYCIRGEYERAIADFSKVIQLKPNYAGGYTFRGTIFFIMQEYDRAIADFDQALRYMPDFFFSLYGRGVTKLKKGDIAGGTVDVSAAKAKKNDVADLFASYCLELR